MKKIIILAILSATAAHAGPMQPAIPYQTAPVLRTAPEMRPAPLLAQDKPHAVRCEYSSIKAAARLGLVAASPAIIEAVAGCSPAEALMYAERLEKDGMK
jgi:delta-aminolevulinic acid dehydratase/porphobilinogen synthase